MKSDRVPTDASFSVIGEISLTTPEMTVTPDGLSPPILAVTWCPQYLLSKGRDIGGVAGPEGRVKRQISLESLYSHKRSKSNPC